MPVETQAGATAAAPADGRTLLRVRGVSKRFGAVQALVDVDFEVRQGEVVALVGDNGAGKSTLIKAISGVGPADAGEFEFDGRRVSIRAPSDSARLGIAVRSSIRTWRCATTSTSWRTCSRAGDPPRAGTAPAR
jgi:D-xylose transport system ATP-binding protein